MLLSSSCIGLIFQLQHSFNANAQKKFTKIVDREHPPPPHPFLYEPMGKAKKNQPFRQGAAAAYAPGGLNIFFFAVVVVFFLLKNLCNPPGAYTAAAPWQNGWVFLAFPMGS